MNSKENSENKNEEKNEEKKIEINEHIILKKRDFDLSQVEKQYKKLLKIEDYYFFQNEKNEIIIGGGKLINLHLLSPALFTYQLKLWNNLSEKEYNYYKDNIQQNEILYTVGIITLNSLRKFKYTETINILSLIFKKKENAWVALDFLERFKQTDFILK